MPVKFGAPPVLGIQVLVFLVQYFVLLSQLNCIHPLSVYLNLSYTSFHPFSYQSVFSSIYLPTHPATPPSTHTVIPSSIHLIVIDSPAHKYIGWPSLALDIENTNLALWPFSHEFLQTTILLQGICHLLGSYRPN